MRIKYYLPFLFLSLLKGFAYGQKLNNFDVGLSLGTTSSWYFHEGLGVDLSYQFPFIKVKFGHFHVLNDHGPTVYTFDSINSKNKRPGLEFPRRRRFKNYNYTHLSIQSDFKFGENVLFIGIGAIRQREQSYTKYYIRQPQELASYPQSASKNFGVELRYGVKFKKLELYMLHQEPFKAYILGSTYRFGKSKRNKTYFSIHDRKREKKPTVLALHLRYRAEIPISHMVTSVGFKLDIKLEWRLKNSFLVYGTYNIYRGGIGVDRTNPVYHIEKFLSFYSIKQSRKLSAVRNYSIGILKEKVLAPTAIFTYGAGFALHRYKGPKYQWESKGTDLTPIQKNVLGLNLQSQIRIGPFENGIELNIPFGNLPPSLSIFWAAGINFRKKGEKIIKPSAYDLNPNWQ